MKNYRRTLPPLDLLIFFEAAYRTKSFTSCAAELNVSQAAVSKRIRHMEDWLGEPLFGRDGKRLFPTTAGDRLFQTAAMALEFLQQGIGSLREEARRPLSIGTNTAIGMFWLTAQLRAFGLSLHACPTRLQISDNNQDLFHEGNDLVVAYGSGAVPGWNSVLLHNEELTPVAAPRLASAFGKGQLKTINEIAPAARPPLLNYPRSGPDWVDWHAWFNGLSLKGIEKWRTEQLSTYSQTIGEALQGKGIALGSLILLKSELETGNLIRLSNDLFRSGRGYYLYHSAKTALSSDARNLSDFLIAATRTGDTQGVCILPARQPSQHRKRPLKK